MSTPRFSVIIVAYNGGKFLQKAIDSLAGQSMRDFEALILDNASTDGSIAELDLSGLPRHALIAETENHGFARGNNIAVRHAAAEWLVLLNPDTIAAPDWLETISASIDRYPDTQVFACAQLNLDNPDILDGAGDAYSLWGIPWRACFGHPVSELPGAGHCFSPCGASAVYKKQLFLEYGGFDERFFCYCEDVDLGYRMQLAGHDCMFLPDAIIYHKGSGTTGQGSYFTTYHGNRNRTWLFVKNTPLLLLILTLPGHLAILAYIYYRNRLNFEHTGMKDGLRDGFRNAWSIRRTAEFKTLQRQIPLSKLVLRMAWNPFRMAHRRSHIRPRNG